MNSEQAGSKKIPPNEMPIVAPATIVPDATKVVPDLAKPDNQIGEGSYSGTRDYQKSVKNYLKTADVEQDARDAAPRTADEQRELDEAEKAGKAPASEK